VLIIDKLTLTAVDVVVMFGVLTRRGCSGRDVATAGLESAMRADSKRGLTNFTAESVCGALREPFR
jgi:hypothetical protein